MSINLRSLNSCSTKSLEPRSFRGLRPIDSHRRFILDPLGPQSDPQTPPPTSWTPPLTCIDQSYADVTLKYLQDNKEPVQSNVDDVTTLNLLFGKRCVLRDNDSVQLYGLKGTRSIPTNHSKKNNEILV